MIKKRFYVIKKDNMPLFYFENLDGALSLFKYLDQGKPIDFDQISVPSLDDIYKHKMEKEADYVFDEGLKYQSSDSKYLLGAETIEIYTKEEILEIKEQREKLEAEAKKIRKEKGWKV